MELSGLVRMLRQLTVEIEKSNRLLGKYDLQSDIKVQPVSNLLKWAAPDQQRLSEHIQSIHLLVDSLTDLIKRVIETDHVRAQRELEIGTRPEGLQPLSTANQSLLRRLPYLMR